MRWLFSVVIWLGVGLLALTAVGCAGQTAAPMEAPSRLYDNPSLGIALEWPTGWHTQESQDYVLMLVPDDNKAAVRASISLDVPDLPAHLPGMIPLVLVKNGYLNHLREVHPELSVPEDQPVTVAGVKAQRVRSTWQQTNGDKWFQTALLLVHNDRVYILRGTSDATHQENTQAAFDAIVASMRWK